MSSRVERSSEPAKFEDRKEAGGLLASLLASYSKRSDVITLAIPRGGVPVALEVGRILCLPVRPMVVEKVRLPMHEAWEVSHSIGAVASGGVCVLDSDRIHFLQLRQQDVEQAIALARNDQAHKQELYGRGASGLNIRDKIALLIDDAVASGATMQAAVQALRENGPARIVIAAPVGSTDAIRRLSALVDRIVCPIQAAEGGAIHECYARFSSISDADAYMMMAGNIQRGSAA